MEQKFSKNNESETYNSITHKMGKLVKILILILVLLSILACTIYADGWNLGNDPDLDKIEDQTATAEYSHRSIPEQSVSTPAPTTLPEEPMGSDEETTKVETNEYSVSATNFDCTCQVDGNVTQAIRVEGDQLFLGEGNDEQVYDKISENKYKRSWMGYYISVVDGEEIRVDEEKSTVITLTDTGYVMEHFSGTGSSPCCFHTFTQIK